MYLSFKINTKEYNVGCSGGRPGRALVPVVITVCLEVGPRVLVPVIVTLYRPFWVPVGSSGDRLVPV